MANNGLDLIFPSSVKSMDISKKSIKTRNFYSKKGNEVMKMFEEGFTRKEIAEKFNVDYNVICIFIRMNLRKQKRGD